MAQFLKLDPTTSSTSAPKCARCQALLDDAREEQIQNEKLTRSNEESSTENVISNLMSLSEEEIDSNTRLMLTRFRLGNENAQIVRKFVEKVNSKRILFLGIQILDDVANSSFTSGVQERAFRTGHGSFFSKMLPSQFLPTINMPSVSSLSDVSSIPSTPTMSNTSSIPGTSRIFDKDKNLSIRHPSFELKHLSLSQYSHPWNYMSSPHSFTSPHILTNPHTLTFHPLTSPEDFYSLQDLTPPQDLTSSLTFSLNHTLSKPQTLTSDYNLPKPQTLTSDYNLPKPQTLTTPCTLGIDHTLSKPDNLPLDQSFQNFIP